MKTTGVLLVFLIFFGIAQAEVLIIPQGQGGLINVESNEVLFLYSCQSSPETTIPVFLVSGGITNSLRLDSYFYAWGDNPAAIAGPLQLTFGTNVSTFVSYKKVAGSSLQSEIIRLGYTNEIVVPQGKTLRIFSSIPQLDESTQTLKSFLQGTNISPVFASHVLHAGAEMSGPITIKIWTTTPSEYSGFTSAVVYSYYLTDDYLPVFDMGAISSPTGNFEITVEKSTNLTNWNPVMIQNVSDDSKAFYRLKLVK